jgi:predicted permease
MLRDLRLAFRSLLRTPGFTAVAVLSLALGIGANSAVFTLFDQVLLRLLPVRDPESLVMVASRGSHSGNNRGANALSYPMFDDYRERNQVFTGMLARFGAEVNLGWGSPGGGRGTGGDATERTTAELVSGEYFELLGVGAAVGRVFTASDETAAGANPIVVLDHELWRHRFAADPAIVGQPVRINDHPMTVVGVAAPGFHGVSLGFRPSLYVPVTMKAVVTPSWDDFDNRRSRWLHVYARLRPGVTREQAEASIGAIYKQIIQEEVKEDFFREVSPYGIEQFLASNAVVLPAAQGFSTMRTAMEMPLRILGALVLLVLLIACANVSNLLVARASAREREISIRLGLGAGRGRIVRQLLVESFVLAATGALCGLVVSYWTTRALRLLAPDEQVRLAISPAIDSRVLGFSLAAGALAAILFGLLPALQVSRPDLVAALKEQAGSIAGGRARLRRTLVVVQVALSLVLLMGSGLFLRSLRHLRTVDPGFEPTNLVRFKVDPMLSGHDVPAAKAFYEELQQRLQSIPGVESVGLAVVPIMEGDEWDSTVRVEGYQSQDGENMNPHFNAVSPDYFATLGMPLVAGRDFDASLGTPARKAVIVNETFAQRYFGDRSPLGYHLGWDSPPSAPPDLEIVGVVADARYEGVAQEIPRQIFVSYRQNDWATAMTAYVRTVLPAEETFAAIRAEVRRLDPRMPLFDMNTMEDQLDRSLAIQKLVAFLSSAFGALATVLALVGLYGVTAYGVARRSREIGIRMALGAASTRVVRGVLSEVLALAAVGVAIALPATWFLGQLVRSQLHGVEPRDPLSFALAIGALLVVAAVAGAVPARRASRVDPAEVLRYE